MPSAAANKAWQGLARHEALRRAATVVPFQPQSEDERQGLYHAALAAEVASWDAYINALVREFYTITAMPTNPTFSIIHQLAHNSAERLLERFNTPNWANSRNLLQQTTGYDPYGDWRWSRRNMNVQQLKIFLNEVLKVRHSFAHGFPIPAFTWTVSSGGRVRLTSKAILDIEALVKHLIKATDRGMKAHIQSNFNLSLPW
jgi:hypothetical protein